MSDVRLVVCTCLPTPTITPVRTTSSFYVSYRRLFVTLRTVCLKSLWCMQVSLARARDDILRDSGLPGAGSEMGTPGSIYEAVTQLPDDRFHPNSGWPADAEDRHARVIHTRTALGFNWHYSTDCQIEDHGHVEITAFQCGRWRNPAAVLIPHGPPQSLQDAVNALFVSGSAFDFSFPGPAPCPSCVESCVQDNSASLWSILPWGACNAPDRLFLTSSRVDGWEDGGEPPVPSPNLIIGVEYCLVAVVYSIPNHFVTQLRSSGRWLKYDCILGGSTTESDDFDSDWYHGYQHMYVYLRKSMMVPPPQP